MSARLKPLTLDDAEEYAAVLRAERAFMAPYEPVRPDAFYTGPGQHRQLEARLARIAEGLEAVFAVVDDDGRITGGLQLTAITRGAYQSASLGYWVAHPANGRGYASAAVREALAWAFATGLHRVDAATLVDNVRSQRVLAKNGFTRVGTAPGFAHIAGQWRDHRLFQRLAP